MNAKETIEALRSRLQLKHMAFSTERTYVYWVRRFCVQIMTYPASWSSERKVEAFLSRMAKDGFSASSQNQAFNAVLFLYREVLGYDLNGIDAMRAKTLTLPRYTPSEDETRRLLEAVTDLAGYPTRLITFMLYGCGLRVSEPLNLRIRDVRLDDSRLVLWDTKHGSSRVVSLPCSLADPVRRQILASKVGWLRDVQAGVPVALPNRMARKYNYARHSWQWYWLFPASNPCRHPRTKEVVRYRCLEGNVQRAVRYAARKCGLEGITPHCLRHAYATHALNRGENVRAVQAALGHKHLDTTMAYIHADATSVRSPIESIL